MKKKVFVGLSGGVDSSTSAAILKRDGYDVTGVFIKIWQPEFIECTWAKDRLDAMRVAAALGIPFKEIDLSTEYKEEVVADMIAQYKKGFTPNPDVACNERIKFGTFAQWCFANGADLIATGHYAQTVPVASRAALMRGKDRDKDQSYFLYRIDPNVLAKTLFPVGGMYKSAVRTLAASFSLPVASKHDSQGLCFVGDVSIRDFLRRFIDVPKGAVLDASGVEIGSHEGAALYTIGQRHGFTLKNASGMSAPHYVIKIDTERNTITVSSNKNDAAVTSVRLSDMHRLRTIPAEDVLVAQTRYHEDPVPVTISDDLVTFAAPHIVSRGQSLVLYHDDECVGGGVIA